MSKDDLPSANSGKPARSRRATGVASVKKERRVGRPSDARSGEIERSIIVAATDLFCSVGYEATTMEAVAQLAGVSKRTLYARHATKEHLVKSVVEDRVRKWADEASRRVSNLPEDFVERMKCHAQALSAQLGEPEVQQFDRLILTTGHRVPDIAETFYKVGYTYELRFLADEIVRGTMHDAVPARDPERVARHLMTTIQGWRRTEETIRVIDPEEAAQFAADAVEMLFRGRDSW